jgi:hypothetical protein
MAVYGAMAQRDYDSWRAASANKSVGVNKIEIAPAKFSVVSDHPGLVLMCIGVIIAFLA